ncbi:hypothetical protein HPB52_023190 [Rhipicephalus sanguineus]|uniref:Uncharacterized protein n=1 Tax=Rhipicephalus sanguineus TaxID=34632 RepID=A0A9D4T4H4_RHISA|nr:hypothetical protein HPB52_023190 [Rhipicephalus sanguineus]
MRLALFVGRGRSVRGHLTMLPMPRQRRQQRPGFRSDAPRVPSRLQPFPPALTPQVWLRFVGLIVRRSVAVDEPSMDLPPDHTSFLGAQTRLLRGLLREPPTDATCTHCEEVRMQAVVVATEAVRLPPRMPNIPANQPRERRRHSTPVRPFQNLQDHWGATRFARTADTALLFRRAPAPATVDTAVFTADKVFLRLRNGAFAYHTFLLFAKGLSAASYLEPLDFPEFNRSAILLDPPDNYLVLDETWSTLSPSSSTIVPAPLPAALCVLGGCAPTQSANSFTLIMQVFGGFIRNAFDFDIRPPGILFSLKHSVLMVIYLPCEIRTLHL